jgi:hypothetical protein
MRTPPGLAADKANIPKSVLLPITAPPPEPGIPLKLHDDQDPLVKYKILQLYQLTQGTSFLLRSNIEIWHGITRAPRYYFEATQDSQGKIELRERICAGARLCGVSWKYFFVLYNAAWKEYIAVPGESVRIKYQDILGTRAWEGVTTHDRELCKRRLQNEIRVCEALLERERMDGRRYARIAEYKGVVIDEESAQVEAIAYAASTSDLLEFVDKWEQWEAWLTVITLALEGALKYLKEMGIAHVAVKAKNVYLTFSVRTMVAGERKESLLIFLEQVVLGNFEHAVFANDMTPESFRAAVAQDVGDLQLLKLWMLSTRSANRGG